MASRWILQTLALYLCFTMVLSQRCPIGFNYNRRTKECNDQNECDDNLCGANAVCQNTNGSYYCQCLRGFRSSTNVVNFTGGSHVECKEINECIEHQGICGPNARCDNTPGHYECRCVDGFISSTGAPTFHDGENVTCEDKNECEKESVCGQNANCTNTEGSYYCMCKAGFGLKSRKHNFRGNEERCEDVCLIDKAICGNGTCHHGADGHYCSCLSGFTNYGNKKFRCTALTCDTQEMTSLAEQFPGMQDVVGRWKKSCEELRQNDISTELNEDDLLQRLLSAINDLLSSGTFTDNKMVSTFLDLVENTLRIVAPFVDLTQSPIRKSSGDTELHLHVHKGVDLPRGAMTLSSKRAKLGIQMETAAGDPSDYPGFATMSLLSYSNLEDSANGFFSGMKQQTKRGFKIDSKIVTVTVSNRNTSHLKEPVNITFYHLQKTDKSNHTCVFWNSSESEGTWSDNGCRVVESNSNHTVCSCSHLSSFAVLLALHDIEDKFQLEVISWVGLSFSLVCLFICILTFWLIRSIQSPRTTIHLHLCINLFIANLIFLAGISRTENRVGCAVVAGLLHFFYLAAFCWMCLEGIQLFRMVVLVFNTSFKSLYMMAGGYGVPAVIVTVSALANAKGYGTERYCWLNLELIWSFFGPVCVIIIVNIFFFLITAWKLAQKFSSLNPDLDSLQKIKAFTITAVAQLCVLGITWIFGCFQFQGGMMVMTYLFTIFGSFQGFMLFIMHCVFAKQVREEYGNILSNLCAPKKKKYSEFSSSHSSKTQASKTTQDTAESHF